MSEATVASELYRKHAFYKGLVSEARQLGRPPVDFVRMEQPPFEEIDPPSGFLCFAVDLAPGYSQFEVDFGDGLKTFDASPKDFGYVNPTEGSTLYRSSSAADMLFVSAPVESIAKGLELELDVLRGGIRPLYTRVIDNRWYMTHALSLWRLANDEGPFSALAVEHGFLALVARLLLEAEEKSGAHRSINAPTLRNEDVRVSRVCDYIEDNLERNHTLTDLAAVSNLSAYHFCRVFKAATGLTPRAYVSERRLARGMRLLTETQASVTEIAMACGFASSQHFASTFRKKTGVTPSAYRSRKAS